MLFGNELDAFENTSTNGIADVFTSSVRVQIAHCVRENQRTLGFVLEEVHTVDASAPSLYIGIDESSRERHRRQAR